MSEIRCDKCGSSNVVKVMQDRNFPDVKPKTMSDYIKDPDSKVTYHNAVMVYHQYRFECDNCGYKSDEFTE